MTFNDVFAISPAAAGLLAQVLPVFLLVFAIEGGKLIEPTRSGLGRFFAHLFRLFIVAFQLASIVGCIVVVQLDHPMIPGAGVLVWCTLIVSLVFLYLLINAVVSRESRVSLNSWLDQVEEKRNLKG